MNQTKPNASLGDRHYLELTELARHLRAGELTSVDITRAQLERIAVLDRTLASYAFVSAGSAMRQAEQADAEIAAGQWRGPLHGVPIGVKDLCWTRDMPTAAGMSLHRQFQPLEDSTVVRRLRAAGAVLLGKLQLTEGAYSDHHPSIVAPSNPWNRDYWPGISSSGPGVALAAGLCFGALGSDTGGSIRWPCAANGVTGLKPTWGRVSRHGVFELAATLDHVGPMARSVADCALLLQAIAGADAKDPTALLDPVPDYSNAIAQGAAGLRIGIDWAWNEDVHPETRAMLMDVIDTFRSMGAQTIEVSVPDMRHASADWFVNCAVEAAVAHAATYPAQRNEYGSVLAGVLDAGRAIAATEYQQVLLRRLDLRGRLTALLSTIDVLLTPVQPFAPLSLATIRTLGEQPELIDKLQRYTCPFDMTGHPTLCLPGGYDNDGMPMGFQLVAAHLGEPALIRAGTSFQSMTAWHRRRPAAVA